MNIIEVPHIPGIEHFVPKSHLRWLIDNMWDTYQGFDQVPYADWLAVYCEPLLELAGLQYADDIGYFYDESDRMYGEDDEAKAEYEKEIQESYEDEIVPIYWKILDYYQASYRAGKKLYHPSIVEVW